MLAGPECQTNHGYTRDGFTIKRKYTVAIIEVPLLAVLILARWLIGYDWVLGPQTRRLVQALQWRLLPGRRFFSCFLTSFAWCILSCLTSALVLGSRSYCLFTFAY